MIKAKYQIPWKQGQVLPLHFARNYAVHMLIDSSHFRILCCLKKRPFELKSWCGGNFRHYSCLGAFDLGYVALFSSDLQKDTDKPFVALWIIFFSMTKTCSPVLLALMDFWLHYSSVKWATSMCYGVEGIGLRRGSGAARLSLLCGRWNTGVHQELQSFYSRGNQQHLDQIFYSMPGTMFQYSFPQRVTGIEISGDIY